VPKVLRLTWKRRRTRLALFFLISFRELMAISGAYSAAPNALPALRMIFSSEYRIPFPL
jgi:hypothetical protein